MNIRGRHIIRRQMALLALLLLGSLGLSAAEKVLYVSNQGSYTASGDSWETSISNLQVAINSLNQYLSQHGGDTGAIYVAAGEYYPTVNLDDYFRDGNNSTLDVAFIVYEGITIYGGFPADGSVTNPADRPRKSGGEAWEFVNETRLSGCLSTTKTPNFTYQPRTGSYSVPAIGSSNHVVWFASNDGDQYSALARTAAVDGCTIMGGYANSRTTEKRDHTGFGGGAYLVENSELRNCIVRNCAATMRGGGVYMDGGGVVDHCLIETCQAEGVGITDGFGGGVCIDYNGTLKHSVITQCSARVGGGLALCYEPDRSHEAGGAQASNYTLHAIGSVVSNCTSTAEAGGVYLSNGGTLNHLTIVRNRNFGYDITYGGRRYGRSGGLYINNGGQCYNSVVWGNVCDYNNDVQYAAYTKESTTQLRPQVLYSGFGNHDITDWSGTSKTNVYALYRDNESSNSMLSVNVPAFVQPTTEAGILTPAATGTDWTPKAHSSLIDKGIQVTDYSDNVVLYNAHLDEDYHGEDFSPVSVLGALVNLVETMRGVENLAVYGDDFKGSDGSIRMSQNTRSQKLLTVFVDPNHEYDSDDVEQGVGYSWDHPVNSLSKAIQIAFNWRAQKRREAGHDDGFGWLAYDGEAYKGGYEWSAAYASRNDEGDGDWLPVQIFVKEGAQSTGGPSSFQSNDLRSGCIRPINDLHVYGGFPATLTGTSTDGRNPKTHPSRLISNLINSDYSSWATHVISLTNVQNTIFDGLQLYYGAATTSGDVTQVGSGGGIIVSNNTPVWVDKGEKKIPQTNNLLRNCVIANCVTDGDGSAIYVNAANTESDITAENCIFHNNKAMDGVTDAPRGTVTANGGNGVGTIVLNHCNIVQNQGYALRTKGIVGNAIIRCNNTIVHANANIESAELKTLFSNTNILTISGENITGENCLFDGLNLPNGFTDSQGVLTRDEATNISYTFPLTVNPTTNVGLSANGDITKFGGDPDWTPRTANPVVNAANDTGTETDLTTEMTRNRGGAADIGALECADLPEDGAVIYVTQNGAGKMDGSSWGNAIAGNLVYRVGGSYVVDTEHADKDGQYVTTQNHLYKDGFAVDYVFQTGTTTYVNKQTVTQKRINLTVNADGSVTTEDGGSTTLDEKETSLAVTQNNTLTRQPSQYIYGEKSGASRNFYRTNLKDAAIAGAYQRDNDTQGYSGFNIDNDLFINNDRQEDYVSGLQFAVEKAAVLNKDVANAADRVQVWVGNGLYEDYKGFVMRDKVAVYGGFPASALSTPGMNERHALVSTRIPLSAQNGSLDGHQGDYETILQVQGKRPYTDDYVFNEEVANFWDKDFEEKGNKTVTSTVSVTIPTYYRRDANGDGTYSDWYEVRGDNVVQDMTSRILNPSFEMNGGRNTDGWNNSKAKHGWTMSTGANNFTLSAGNTNTAVHGAEIKNKTTFEFYQDIASLEEGFYRVSCQGFNQGSAEGNVKLFANGTEKALMVRRSEDASVTATNAGVDLLAGGKYDDNWIDVYVGANTNLRIGLKGNYTGNGWTMFDNFRLERLSGDEVAASRTSTVKEEGYTERTEKTTYTTIRKPVLFMPDVCLTTYWPGAIGNSDNPSNQNRAPNRSSGNTTPIAGSGYVPYERAEWDGFTIRNGFLYDYFGNRDGGAGVRMYEGGTLQNCVVVDNGNTGGRRSRGGGGYCDGKTSYVIGCFFIDNLNSGRRKLANGSIASTTDKDTNGGGIYLLVGTCYNSLLANNVCWGNDSRGAGIYIESATFYNNTVAYNNCYDRGGNIQQNKGNGVHQYEGNMGATLNVFNTIFYKNGVNTKDATQGGYAIWSQNNDKLKEFKNCYIQSEKKITETKVTNKIKDSFLYNGYNVDCPNPFALGDAAKAENNYRLSPTSLCINQGNIPADQEDTFPQTDVDFEERVQDCQIDIGAYEYNGAADILPTVGTDAADNSVTTASFYVTQNGAGTSSAHDVANPACWRKLQKVLDAAARYKYDNPWHQVIVKLAATNLGDGNYFKYMPTRSNVTDGSDRASDPRTHSIIVPLGVELWGGYAVATDGTFVDSQRDVIQNKTIVSAIYQDEGQDVNCYHSVSFTDLEFDEDGVPTGRKLSDVQGSMGRFNRAVLDGLFLEDGDAAGATEQDKRGGGAVVTAYAHVRNCIVQDNQADDYGGGLYVENQGLVSGCVVQANRATWGGGIAVAEPELDANGQFTSGVDTYGHIISCTVVNNSSTTQGGGLYFRSNVRANSCIFWQNSSDDQGNVAGTTNTNQEMIAAYYPLNYCAVEAQRVAGVNNVSVASDQNRGVRWQLDRGQTATETTYNYYGITVTSDLARTGMPYYMYEELQGQYGTLTLADLAGINRMAETQERELSIAGATVVTAIKNNKFIEIGARALNLPLTTLYNEKNIMKRLYVSHTDNINTVIANKLSESGDIMYRQKGSSFANPMMRLDDALDYIRDVRTEVPDYANTRFEVFVAGGTYYPYHDVNGEQGSARNYTFVVPEGVTIVGGIDPLTGLNDDGIQQSTLVNHFYCQAGYGDETANLSSEDFTENTVTEDWETSIDGINLVYALTDDIRKERQHYDQNHNSVSEPWEMEKQTIFSGQSATDEETNIYHVITCLADENSVGPLPTGTDQDRTIIIDGVTISFGNAKRYSPTAINKNMFFRGGGILVDGNWTGASDEAEQPATTGDMPLASRNIPLVLANCSFQENTAVQGGAIFTNGDLSIFGCSFAKNLAETPSSSTDDTQGLPYIKNCGGGAISCNGTLLAVNTIFANNEARRYTARNFNGEQLTENPSWSNAKSAWGGTIWAGNDAQTRFMNCDIVCNKAEAYPAIYNTVINSDANNLRHYAVSTIFWGNKASSHPELMDFDRNNTAQDALFFCAYEEDKGPTATAKPNSDQTIYQMKPFNGNYMGHPEGEWFKENLGNRNHNIIINEENDAPLNGPRFTFPARDAGYDEYVPSADWFVYRYNSLCDNGWTGIDQTITSNGLDYTATFTPETLNDGTHTGFAGAGIYKAVADEVKKAYNMTLMPYGDDYYMAYASGVYQGQTMKRISSDPQMGAQHAYIDVGVYEYQHVQLMVENADNSEVDCIWVSETENIENGNSGLHWNSPTTNLQRAINTLLLSRNGHDKEVRFIKGTYSPTNVNSKGMLSITIDIPTNHDAVFMPIHNDDVQKTFFGIRSITLRGGYSSDYEAYDPANNPVVFEMQRKGNASDDQLHHLVDIVCAEDIRTQEDDLRVSEGSRSVVPIIIEGITFRNQLAMDNHDGGSAGECYGGSAINYRDQYHYSITDGSFTDDVLEAPENGQPKLTIRGCKFVQNGADVVPVVSIGKGGGVATIYNSVFHSNKGNPVEAHDETRIINNTFALNGGHTMADEGVTVEFHNNIVWRDDANNGHAQQIEGISSGEHMTHNALTGITADATYHNDPLSDENEDILEGPNFKNPEDADVFSRDFSVSPSMRILHTASPQLYEQLVIGQEHPEATSEKDWINYTALEGGAKETREAAARVIVMNHEYWRLKDEKDDAGLLLFDVLDAAGNVVETGNYQVLRDMGYSFLIADHVDMSGQPRYSETGMERGAYECLTDLHRVVYADPSRPQNAQGGDMWQNAYGRTQMQSAIDAAAIYSYTHEGATAYVLMRGRPNSSSIGETLTARSGVQVFGSITGYEQVVNDAGELSEADADIERYIAHLKENDSQYRTPMAVSENRTTINGLKTGGQGYTTLALFDGFDIHGSEPAATPVVSITKPNIVLRNSIVQGNATTGCPTVEMKNGLLYNVLLRDNTTDGAQPVVSLTGDAYALNCTGIPNREGQTVLSAAEEGRVLNCINIVNYADRFLTFAPYLRRGATAYNGQHYNTNQNLWYQLHEQSSNINAGDNSAQETVAGYTYQLNGQVCYVVDYDTDLDLLGNPRLLMGRIDRGCFETWKIADGDIVVNTADDSYGGHYHPHMGSVVYVMDNRNLIMAKDNFVSAAMQPSYLLLKQGASLYVNADDDYLGNRFQCVQVSVEKAVAAGYQFMALPFRMRTGYTTTNTVTTDSWRDQSVNLTAYTYDSEKRAQWHGGFYFRADNSTLWSRLAATSEVQNCQGWLLDNSGASGTYRFNGLGDNNSDYIYTEYGPQTVTLTQYDDRTSTDGDASFTKLENMGWNLTGMPYLVNTYRTAELRDGAYAMNVPHVLYTMQSNGSYVRASGQVYSYQSWDDATVLPLGEGYFTQTATLDATEALTFRIPTPGGGSEGAARQRVAIGRQENGLFDDVATIRPSATATAAGPYQMGSDALKWQAFDDQLAQLYVPTSGSTRLSLLSAAPVETDIRLGFVAPQAGGYVVSLPEPEAYEGYEGVWLTDSETGTVTNLLTGSYTMDVAEAGDFAGRLLLRFGGSRPALAGVRPEGPSVLKLAARHGRLPLHGLPAEERISIYDVRGQLVFTGLPAQADEITLPDGIYIVQPELKKVKRVH